jgi:hypothetical protein
MLIKLYQIVLLMIYLSATRCVSVPHTYTHVTHKFYIVCLCGYDIEVVRLVSYN